MLIPTAPANEEQRLRELYALAVLDTADEPLFDDLVKLSAHIMGCPISLISLVDHDRQWFKAKVGIDVPETSRDVSFCAHAIHRDETFIVEDAAQDDRFSDNPLVSGDPNIRFYAGHPLKTSEGYRIGTLCAIDRVSKKLSATQREMLEALARQAVSLLERRRNELTLEMTKRNSQNLFEKIPATILSLKGPHHAIDYMSSRRSKLFGDDDATNKSLLDVHPEAKESGLLAVLDQVYQDGQTSAVRETTFRVGGQNRYYNFVFTPSYGLNGNIDGVMGIVEDVTQRKRLELAVERLNAEKAARYEKMAELLEQVPVGIALVEGEDHRFVFANRLYREYFINQKAYVGRAAQDVVPKADKKPLLHILEKVRSTGEAHVGQEENLVRTFAHGEEEDIVCNFVYEATKAGDGSTTGVFAAISDITEQVRARAEISAKVDALRAERDIRERFVATLTHDLRTPLTAAKLSAQLLKRKAENPQAVATMATRIIGSIDRGENMVRDLLDANRLKAGQGLPISVDQCNLASILEDALHDFRMVRGRDFTVGQSTSDVSAYWDKAGVQRIIENLVNNAVKYGEVGTDITVAADKKHDSVDIQVHNYGPTIPAQEQSSLFKTYTRSSSAQSGGQKGWGIGLTLVKGIAEAHGGHVRVESCEGEGTTFFVNLPLDCRPHP